MRGVTCWKGLFQRSRAQSAPYDDEDSLYESSRVMSWHLCTSCIYCRDGHCHPELRMSRPNMFGERKLACASMTAAYPARNSLASNLLFDSSPFILFLSCSRASLNASILSISFPLSYSLLLFPPLSAEQKFRYRSTLM